jgi:hypothetical protein
MTPLSQPLPFFAYPVLVATFIGWIVTQAQVVHHLREPDSMCRRPRPRLIILDWFPIPAGWPPSPRRR